MRAWVLMMGWEEQIAGRGGGLLSKPTFSHLYRREALKLRPFH